MLRIGITGGLGTGKSTVTAMLEELGVPTISADTLAHACLELNSPCYHLVVEEFGAAMLNELGTIDRRILASVVFGDASKRQRLENILHPVILKGIETWCAEHEARGTAIVAIELPLLFEAGLSGMVDEIWVVVCEPTTQVVRAMGRGLTREAALARIAAQMPLSEKTTRAHRIIDTECGLSATQLQVREALEELCGRAT